jgi:hypothetical protein
MMCFNSCVCVTCVCVCLCVCVFVCVCLCVCVCVRTNCEYLDVLIYTAFRNKFAIFYSFNSCLSSDVLYLIYSHTHQIFHVFLAYVG